VAVATTTRLESSPANFRLAWLRPRNVFAEWGLLELFVLSQTVLPALLYLPGTQPIRVPIRISAFGASLLLLARYFNRPNDRRQDKHPACAPLTFAMFYLGLMIFHPTTNTFLAATAQVMLYLSVLAPVFWAAPLATDSRQLRRLLGIILVCSGINSFVGVMQVYDPADWQPKEISSFAKDKYAGHFEELTYVNAGGELVYRPAGLSDNPGAVAGPATFAVILGYIFAMATISLWRRIASACIGVVGLMAIFLSDVRTAALIAAGSVAVYTILLLLQKNAVRAAAGAILLAVAGSFAFSAAVLLGGESVRERFQTITNSNLVDLYYKESRGGQIEYAGNTLLVQYPFGAGLGRWGMMHGYFGDDYSTTSPPIWAELQPNAWIIDGGIILLTLYVAALFLATRHDFRIAMRAPSKDLRTVALMVLGVNMAMLAFVFGYTPFTTQLGVQYWLLTGVLHGAARGGMKA
jgi:hypothetical protein